MRARRPLFVPFARRARLGVALSFAGGLALLGALAAVALLASWTGGLR